MLQQFIQTAKIVTITFVLQISSILKHIPNITFVSTDIVKKGDNEYDVTGDMTVKDVTKKITFKLSTKVQVKIHGA